MRSSSSGFELMTTTQTATRPSTRCSGSLVRFDQIRDAAGVPEATLHRLRHNVATYLVAHGQILQAQARLGHADAATTLREYAYALPLTDATVADALDAHLNRPRDEPAPSNDPQPPTRDQR
jgi:integrase